MSEVETAPTSAAAALALTAENAVEIWNLVLGRMSGMVVEHARQFDAVAISPPNRLVVRFKAGYDLCKSACERPEQVARFEQALADVTGQRVGVVFALASSEPGRRSHRRPQEGVFHLISGCWRRFGIRWFSGRPNSSAPSRSGSTIHRLRE